MPSSSRRIPKADGTCAEIVRLVHAELDKLGAASGCGPTLELERPRTKSASKARAQALMEARRPRRCDRGAGQNVRGGVSKRHTGSRRGAWERDRRRGRDRRISTMRRRRSFGARVSITRRVVLRRTLSSWNDQPSTTLWSTRSEAQGAHLANHSEKERLRRALWNDAGASSPAMPSPNLRKSSVPTRGDRRSCAWHESTPIPRGGRRRRWRVSFFGREARARRDALSLRRASTTRSTDLRSRILDVPRARPLVRHSFTRRRSHRRAGASAPRCAACSSTRRTASERAATSQTASTSRCRFAAGHVGRQQRARQHYVPALPERHPSRSTHSLPASPQKTSSSATTRRRYG